MYGMPLDTSTWGLPQTWKLTEDERRTAQEQQSKWEQERAEAHRSRAYAEATDRLLYGNPDQDVREWDE